MSNINFIKEQFGRIFKSRIILASDVTGEDVLVANTIRVADTNYGKLTVNAQS